MQLKNDVQTISISMNTPNFSSRYLLVSQLVISDEQIKKPGCVWGIYAGDGSYGPPVMWGLY